MAYGMQYHTQKNYWNSYSIPDEPHGPTEKVTTFDTGMGILGHMFSQYWYLYLALIGMLLIITLVSIVSSKLAYEEFNFATPAACFSTAGICAFTLVMLNMFNDRWDAMAENCQTIADDPFMCVDAMPPTWGYIAFFIHMLISGILALVIISIAYWLYWGDNGESVDTEEVTDISVSQDRGLGSATSTHTSQSLGLFR